MAEYGEIQINVDIGNVDMHLLVADVDSRIPDHAAVESKLDAVRQVLEAALDAGWSPPG